MSKADVVFKNWRMFAELTKGQPQEWLFKRKIKDGRQVTCVPLPEVFDAADIELIKHVVRPEKRMCFKNAAALAYLFPDRVMYIEGEVTILNGGMGIDHAWNLVDGEHYVDLTFELALGEDVRKEAYVALGTYDAKTLHRVMRKTGYYGGIYNELLLEDYKRKQRRKTKKSK